MAKSNVFKDSIRNFISLTGYFDAPLWLKPVYWITPPVAIAVAVTTQKVLYIIIFEITLYRKNKKNK
jgi:hypothetical protein